METIETGRLLIRRLRGEDLDELQEVCGDAELMRHVGDGRPLSREQTRRWIEKSQVNYRRHGFGCAAVVAKDGGRFAGYCGLVYGPGGSEVELIYALKRQFRGAGLATEAARAVLEYGFTRCRLSRVVATIDPANLASIRVAEKLGMTHREDRLDEHGLPEAVYAIESTVPAAAGGDLMRVEVVPAAAEQQPVIANLLELYAHDFSQFTDLRLGPDGRFGYPRLGLYWTEADRRPFLVRADGDLAGFVLVRKGPSLSGEAGVWDVDEFFVARGFRRRGVGTLAAHEVWRQIPGRWQVRVLEGNGPALNFWRQAVADFTGADARAALHQVEGKRWHVYTFDAR